MDFAHLYTTDHWLRCVHRDLALVDGALQLHWTQEAEPSAVGEPVAAAGLAFDPWCRLYGSDPEAGQVWRMTWPARGSEPVPLFADPTLPGGDFAPVEAAGPFNQPRALAVDADGRLYVAEAEPHRLLVYDLLEGRLLRRLELPGPPLGLAAAGRRVWLLVGPAPTYAPRVLALDPRRDPRPLPPLPDPLNPGRLAVDPDGRLWLLDRPGEADAAVVPLERPERAFPVPFAGDLAFADGVLVVAYRPGEPFTRHRFEAGRRTDLPGLAARDYDGLGIAAAPDGRVVYRTRRGPRHAVPVRRRYRRRGRLATFRLEAEAFQNVWGRVFVRACVPPGTALRLHCVASDEPPPGPPLAPSLPANVASAELHRPDLTPPAAPLALMPAEDDPGHPVFQRPAGDTLPWPAQGQPEDGFTVWEAPVAAGPGRYLWVFVDFEGNARATPRLRALRVERRGHDLLRRLPAVLSREPAAAAFLQGFLAPLAGLVDELGERSFRRHALLDPAGAPAEVLPWLAEFLGLVLDRRWPEPVRRRAIAEATWLFRFRGTVPGLTRFLQIVLGVRPVILEHFRVRGLGDAVVGGTGDAAASAVLGGGLRVGGALGEGPGEEAAEDAFARHAHRFTVVIPRELDADLEGAVRDLLDTHRPAHTEYDLCTVDAGMRAGLGLYLGVTSVLGPSAGLPRAQLGATLLGRGATLGRRVPGTRVGTGRLGTDSRVG